MELVNVFLKLGGDNNNVVLKSGITVAEAKILYELHGGGASEPIVSVEIIDDVKLDAKTLKEKLRHQFRAKQEYLDVVERVFPGVTPQFIEKAEEMGLPDGVPVAWRPGGRPKTKKTVEVDPLG